MKQLRNTLLAATAVLAMAATAITLVDVDVPDNTCEGVHAFTDCRLPLRISGKENRPLSYKTLFYIEHYS